MATLTQPGLLFVEAGIEISAGLYVQVLFIFVSILQHGHNTCVCIKSTPTISKLMHNISHFRASCDLYSNYYEIEYQRIFTLLLSPLPTYLTTLLGHITIIICYTVHTLSFLLPHLTKELGSSRSYFFQHTSCPSNTYHVQCACMDMHSKVLCTVLESTFQ